MVRGYINTCDQTLILWPSWLEEEVLKLPQPHIRFYCSNKTTHRTSLRNNNSDFETSIISWSVTEATLYIVDLRKKFTVEDFI